MSDKTNDYVKWAINSLYSGAVLSSLSIVNSLVLHKAFNMGSDSVKSVNSIEKFTALTAAVTTAVLEKQYLEDNNMIPVDPYKGL